MAVPCYYCSLSLQALLRIRNNFNESKYKWIEKYIHIVTWSIPCALAIVFTVTENFNPVSTRCWITSYPIGCGTGPDDVPCERGNNVYRLGMIVGISLIFLEIVAPLSIILFMYCQIRKIKYKIEESQGMQRIRGSAQKETMRSIIQQMCLYLFSFWVTYLPGHITEFYRAGTGKAIYWLMVLANCQHAFQGFLFAVVYFALKRMGKQKVESLRSIVSPRPELGKQTTVKDIRENVRLSADNNQTVGDNRRSSRSSSSFAFSIFDGTPDEDSPWAKFIDGDESVEGGLPTKIAEDE